MADFDAIVIGTGPNGLVCALALARAGWRTLVLERSSEVGGGMRTGEVARPGFRHDLYSSNLGRFSLSPLYRDMQAEFDGLGVRFLTSDFPFASVYPGGKALCAWKDTDRLERELAAHSPGDLKGWQGLLAFYQRVAPKFLPLLRVSIPSPDLARLLLRLAATPADAARLLRIVLSSPRQLAERAFVSPEAKGLMVPWALHSDFGPDVRGGAVVPFFFALNSQQQGLWVAEGGAGHVSQAMRNLIERYGGTVLTGTEAKRIVVREGAAVAVETATGETYTASRAVIGNLSPHSLFGRLVSDDDLPAGFLRRVKRFRYGIGTFIVYMALSRPLQWNAGAHVASFNTVHVGGDVDDLATSYEQCAAGTAAGTAAADRQPALAPPTPRARLTVNAWSVFTPGHSRRRSQETRWARSRRATGMPPRRPSPTGSSGNSRSMLRTPSQTFWPDTCDRRSISSATIRTGSAEIATPAAIISTRTTSCVHFRDGPATPCRSAAST